MKNNNTKYPEYTKTPVVS